LHRKNGDLDDSSMRTPTVAGLCIRLDPQLAPAPGFEPPATPIAAVHISELPDPTAYLSGNELLLTTGLALPRSTMGCERYVRRLVGAGVAALALGLGPVHRSVPDELAAACRAAGLCLLVVPEATPFLTVTKAYWSDLGRTAERQLVDVLAAHQQLVDAAAGPEGGRGVLAALVRAIGQWGAVLDADGDIETVWPAAAKSDAAALGGELERLRVTGVRSAASLLLVDDLHVSIHPLAAEERVLGYLALAGAAPPSATDRRLLLTGCALLSIDLAGRRAATSGSRAGSRAVCLLLDEGLPDAARRLASRLGAPPLPARVRLLAVSAPAGTLGDVAVRVRRWWPDVLSCPVDATRSWFVLPVDHPPLERLRETLRRRTPGVQVVLSPAVALEEVPRARARLVRTLETGERPVPDVGGLSEGLDRLVAEPRGDLAATLVGYLRHRGQWEPAARELGVHRNTLRLRVARCRELLGAEVDDPDVSAPLWLLLRERGLT
jgi:purine catabolism regulator